MQLRVRATGLDFEELMLISWSWGRGLNLGDIPSEVGGSNLELSMCDGSGVQKSNGFLPLDAGFLRAAQAGFQSPFLCVSYPIAL